MEKNPCPVKEHLWEIREYGVDKNISSWKKQKNTNRKDFTALLKPFIFKNIF